MSAQLIPRGGAANGIVTSIVSTITATTSSPATLFQTSLFALAMVTVLMKALPMAISKSTTKTTTTTATTTEPTKTKPPHVLSLQIRFLLVFWLLRCADWLQGPYFYEVYSSKQALMGSSGTTAAMMMSRISQLFLTGFASRAVLGPSLGRWSDEAGRKRGTLAFCLIYALGAWSTQSQSWTMLFLGRILGGMGTALLFSAPESWLVGEAQKKNELDDASSNNSASYLGQTFGWVCCYNSAAGKCDGCFVKAGLTLSFVVLNLHCIGLCR
jgi:hypothetical protein